MPAGVTKELFRKFVKYYDEDVFIGAGLNIRRKVRACDEMMPFERIQEIAEIFAAFKNPDKETVLTPWATVNKHAFDTLGGADFFNKDETGLPKYLTPPPAGGLWQSESKILEINSKSGLYPLLCAYNFYYAALSKVIKTNTTEASVFQSLWKRIIENNIYVICKTPMAVLITKRTLAGFSDAKVNAVHIPLVPPAGGRTADGAGTLIAKDDFSLQEAINKYFNVMQFDLIIGNPPYQQSDGGHGASAKPVYQHFVKKAKALQPKYLTLIIPSRWQVGGKGLDDFRNEMLADKHIRILHDYPKSTDCFPNVDIKGGVCYFLWDRDNEGLCEVFTHTSEGVVKTKRFLKNDYCDTFIRYPEQLSIVEKVWGQNCALNTQDASQNRALILAVKINGKNKGADGAAAVGIKGANETPQSFATLVSSLKPYGLRTDFFHSPKKYGMPPISETPVKDGLTIYGLGAKQNREIRYIPLDYPLPKGKEYIGKWKIFVPRAFGCAAVGEKEALLVFGTPIIGGKNDVCTETFLSIGSFASKREAEHCLSYIKTKFFRFLVGVIKTTQDATQRVYQLVPLQDFSEDWTDAKLYAKYGLTAAETDFVERMIRTME